jgi:general stress protein YciG
MSKKQGFAVMDPARQREIASMGGSALDPASRSFAQDTNLAMRAGKLGGIASAKARAARKAAK